MTLNFSSMGPMRMKTYPLCPEETKYEKLAKIGQGTFGEVFKARDKETNKLVAMKKILMDEEEGFPIAVMREMKILRKLAHGNVVKLIEVSHSKTSQNSKAKGAFYLIFEFCEHDLAGLLRNSTVKFTVGNIKWIMKELLNGLSFIHEKKILHRDLKTANILITKDGVLKLADFGLAQAFRNSTSKEDCYTSKEDCYTSFYTSKEDCYTSKEDCYTSKEDHYTNPVVTLWYRPPELLLGERDYTPAIDMWGAGCIFAELWTRSPILQGNTEQHQLQLICQLCGSITPEVWPDVVKLDLYRSMELPKNFKNRVKNRLRDYVKDPQALDLLCRLLILDPARRYDSGTALYHNFILSEPNPSDLKPMLSKLHSSMAPARRRKAALPRPSAVPRATYNPDVNREPIR